MKKIGIVYHPLNKRALEQTQKLTSWLKAQGMKHWICSAWEANQMHSLLPGTELILTAGGDGTILRVAQIVANNAIPITGINLGKLGFMTELQIEEALTKLPDILSGKGWIDERAMLEAELHQTLDGQQQQQSLHALNDVVLARGEIARIIYITANIDGEELATYKADGVILATATGSTGYALAAGGPILYPQSHDYLLVPILSHLSLNHPLVLAPTSTVKLKLTSTNPATLSIDGHISMPLCDGATISVRGSSKTIKFLRLRPPSHFYASLERRLRW